MNRSRCGAVVAAVSLAGWLALGAPLLLASASANTPLGWAKVNSVDKLEAALVLVGIPLALFVAITALVMGPGWARGERRAQTGGGEIETWFGGPTRGSNQLEAADPAGSADKGGAGGRW